SAVPVAVVVGLGAAAWPAVRAGRAAGRVESRRPRRVRGRPVAGGRWRLPLALLLHAPGRSLFGAGAIAVASAVPGTQLALTWVWHGVVVGSLLGRSVSVQSRGVDAVAIAAILAMCAFVIGDVAWLNATERRQQLADLPTLGWTDGEVDAVIVREAG